MITHTHETGLSVNRNRKQQAILDKRRCHFERLDIQGQAYMGFMEYSGLSFDATALFQFLMSKQGGRSHAFPSKRELRTRFRCSYRRIDAAIKELQEALPEVFRVVKEGGKARNSYYLTPYKNWPLSVCERLWFSVPTVGTHCVTTVVTDPTRSVTTVGTLHGNNMSDSTYGYSKRVLEADERCSKCSLPAVDTYRGWAYCERDGVCHQDLAAEHG